VRAGAADHRPVRLVHRMLRGAACHGSAVAANRCRAGVSCGRTLAARHTESPAKAGDDGGGEPTAWMAGRFSYPESPGFHPGLLGPQKAPGGSRGTPGCMPSRVPCAAGSKPARSRRATRRGGR
jgi:hypothetical protein